MNKPKKVEKSSLNLEKIEDISANDVLNHFNKNIFPKIKDKYFSFPAKTKRAISELFSKKQEKDRFNKYENSIYKIFWAEIAKRIFELVVGDNINDIKRINLFLEVMYLEMATTAYANSRLDFNNCAKIFENEWKVEKSKIIQESLKLCDKKFWKGVTTIKFTKDNLIFENGYWTTIQSKEDFFKENK